MMDRHQTLLEPALRKAKDRGGAFRILFVCTGNICRSPLGHAVFDHAVEKRGVVALFETESSGTFGYHIGENADERMRKTAFKYGVRLDHQVRKFSAADIGYFDLLLAMDREHLDYMQGKCTLPEEKNRVVMYRDFDEDQWAGHDVPDPYYGKQTAFEEVFSIVDRTSSVLLNALCAGMARFS